MSAHEDHAANVPTLKEDQQINIEDLKKRVENDDVIVVDVRSADEIASAGRIASNKWLNIPLTELGDALKMSPEEFKEKYVLAKPDTAGNDFVFHCAHGRRGAKATALAISLGYTNSVNLTGGQSVWKAAYPDAS